MSNELSTLSRVRSVKGKAQWAGARYLRTENDGTVVMTVPYLMPGTVVFVHGVNSEGEWYQEAARQLCAGLNKRLGRTDLGAGARSPIIPFYWGYKMQPGDEQRYPGLFHRDDKAWGGGPFQNGTNNLLQFWQDGFKRKVLNGLIDLQRINSDITRQLQDAPARAYFIHAAKRLANLIDTIREDFPNEPLNIVAHSQGNMITLCAMLYVQRRAPDTLILNSAPYSFDAKITDWLGAANGWSHVQSARARLRTFEAVARKIAAAKADYKDNECNSACPASTPGQASTHLHHEPERDDWHGQIGRGEVGNFGQCWNECGYAGRDNRGKVFVNFNPHDRVIGIAAIQGIGWRGIREQILSQGRSTLPNVYQRVFARNSGTGAGDTPAVGFKSGYWFNYFHTQINVPEDVTTDDGARLTTTDGRPVQTRNDYVRTYDNKLPKRFWNILPDKVAGLFGVQSTPSWTERVWIDAPTVPEPPVIEEDFDEGAARFDGTDDDPDAPAQRQDFADFSRHYVPETRLTGRPETPDQVKAKLARYAEQSALKTNHGTILTYGSRKGQAELVRQVISYDITVGQGYAFGDAEYWQYLLDLANWKVSDPYYATAALPAAGPYPRGLDPETVAPVLAKSSA